MAQYFFSSTAILDCEASRLSFYTDEQLWKATKKNLFSPEDGNPVFNSVFGSSRRGWAGLAIHKLCELSKTPHLGFLYGSRLVEGRWRFIDEERGLGTCGYAFDGQAMTDIAGSIDELMQWSKSNIDRLDRLEMFSRFAQREDLAEALAAAGIDSRPAGSAAYGEDGEGPWYLFSYLLSVGGVVKEALAARKDVLHVSTVGWELRDEWTRP